jgi:hypothetical protein
MRGVLGGGGGRGGGGKGGGGERRGGGRDGGVEAWAVFGISLRGCLVGCLRRLIAGFY